MLCLAALIVFAVLGIFSLHYRELAKQAFDCVFRRLTLRPCEVEFGRKIKNRITGRLMQKSVRAAKLFNQSAEVLAWIFVILSVASFFYSMRGLYNLVRYQTCSPGNPTKCVLNRLPFFPSTQTECTINPPRSHEEIPSPPNH